MSSAGPAVAASQARFGEVVKEGDGPVTLILVPCLGCDWRSWQPFIESNRARYTMYAVTWPGMGSTELPDLADDAKGTPLWDNLVVATKNLIERQGLERPILVGHSAASVYAVLVAHRHPGILGGVITVDGTITNWDTFGFSPQQRLAWATAEMEDVRRQYDNDAAWAELNKAPTSYSPERNRLYGTMWMTPPREHVLRYWTEWLRVDAGRMLEEVEVPVLALFAIRSTAKDPEKVERERRERYQRAGLIDRIDVRFIANSGHTIWESQPAAFDLEVARFAASVAAGAD